MQFCRINFVALISALFLIYLCLFNKTNLLYPIELNTFSISPWLHSLFIKHNRMLTAHSQLGSSFTQTGATTSARNGYNWGPAECKLLMFPICRCRHCTWHICFWTCGRKVDKVVTNVGGNRDFHRRTKHPPPPPPHTHHLMWSG